MLSRYAECWTKLPFSLVNKIQVGFNFSLRAIYTYVKINISTDVWLRYIQFELVHGDASRVGNLHYRAKLTLDSALTDRFLTQYTLLQLKDA